MAGSAQEENAAFSLAVNTRGLRARAGDDCGSDAGDGDGDGDGDGYVDGDGDGDGDDTQGHTLGMNAYLGLGASEEKSRDARNK